MGTSSDTSGLRVYVAEDEVLLSMLLEEMLEDLGCSTVGPYTNLAGALSGADADDFDVALVDLNLNGQSAEPVLERLAARGIPFAIASGANAPGYPHVLGKPYGFDDLERTLAILKAELAR